jgi:plasmid stability protein
MVPIWSYNGTVPVSLSIKNVPDEVVEKLRMRAQRNRRSLQGELLEVIEKAADETPALTIEEVYERAKARGLTSQSGESVRIIRKMRADRTRQLMRLLGKPRDRR